MGEDLQYYGKPLKDLRNFKSWLGIIGMWPLETHSASSRFRWSYLLISEVFTISNLLIDIIQHCKGLEVAVDALTFFLSSLVSFLVLVTDVFTSKYKRLLIESVIEDWSIMRPRHQWLVMEKYSINARRIYMLFLISACVCCGSFILTAMPWKWLLTERSEWNISTYRNYAVPASCVWADVSTPVYFAIMIQNCVELILHPLCHGGNDGLLLMLSMHLAGQFNILGTDFATIEPQGSGTTKRIKILARRHRHLAHLSDTLESAFNANILYQFLMLIILICTEGFLFISRLSEGYTNRVWKHIIFVVGLLVELFLYCLAGQSLEEESQELSSSIYTAPWYEFDVKTMKFLPLIMLRANIPHQLTAGKFVVINYISFKDSLKASASYMSVLKVMLEAH